MIKVLIVQDVCERNGLLRPILELDIVCAKSVQTVEDAQRELLDFKYDLLILDIQIPNSLGDFVNQKGGVELLEWINLSGHCKKPSRIIGLTSHEDSKNEYETSFIESGFHLLKSSEVDSAWLKTIKSTCIYLNSQVSSPEEVSCDVALLTAMSHNELQAILDLKLEWEELVLTEDPTIYYRANIDTSGGKKVLIAASSARMGLTAASALASKMCIKIKPKYIVMTGIAAGIKGKVELGDVLVADPCWDWGNGKLTGDCEGSVFQPAPHPIPLAPKIRMKLQKVRDRTLYLDTIKNSWRGSKPSAELKLRIGPVASGAVVLEDPKTIANIVLQQRETIGVEMEAYAVMVAPSLVTTNEIVPIIIKSVCDFADPNKNDDWQDYASYTSANFAYSFIANELFT